MRSQATGVEEYLAELTAERRETLQAVREVVLKNLPRGYEEGMQYGMIGYFVPHRLYPAGYHCDPRQPLPFASLASQKHHLSIYLTCIYSDPEHLAWFREAWAKTGKKLDMGKGCVRFKTIDDVPLKVVGQAIKRVPVKKFIAQYEAVLGQAGGKRSTKTAKKKVMPKTTAQPNKRDGKKVHPVRRRSVSSS